MANLVKHHTFSGSNSSKNLLEDFSALFTLTGSRLLEPNRVGIYTDWDFIFFSDDPNAIATIMGLIIHNNVGGELFRHVGGQYSEATVNREVYRFIPNNGVSIDIQIRLKEFEFATLKTHQKMLSDTAWRTKPSKASKNLHYNQLMQGYGATERFSVPEYFGDVYVSSSCLSSESKNLLSTERYVELFVEVGGEIVAEDSTEIVINLGNRYEDDVWVVFYPYVLGGKNTYTFCGSYYIYPPYGKRIKII